MTYRIFVGRGNELARSQEWLDTSPGKLVLITGFGGVGKTSLLQKIREEYTANDHFVVEYFDMAEQPTALVNQAVHLARSIGLDHYPEFKRKMNDLIVQTGELTQMDQAYVDEAVDCCIQETAKFLKTQDKKLLLIIDTFETALKYQLYEDDRITKSFDKLKTIPGAGFVIAGRDKSDDSAVGEEIYPLMRDIFGQENVLHLPLQGFSPHEMETFFVELDPHDMIPQEMRQKLYLLTDGRPVLLSLAVDWLQRSIPLPVMIEKSLPELTNLIETEAARREVLNSFEFELVSGVRQLRTPLDVAVLYMAHIDRRMDGELLSLLLNLDPDEGERVIIDLLKHSFVKNLLGSVTSKCALHDEMCVLVNKYAWKYLDIGGEQRKGLIRKVIEQYYWPHINILKQKKQELIREALSKTTLLQKAQTVDLDWERWLLEAETVYYSTKLNQSEGIKSFDELFYDGELSNIRDQFLFDELKRAGLQKDTSPLDEASRNKVSLREADMLRRRRELRRARQICQVMMEKEDLNEEDRIHALTILGSMDFESNPTAAERSFSQALDLAVSKKDQRVQAILHNNLGRLYRNICQLEPSIIHFKQALEMVRKSQTLEMTAAILNNLAWTYRLNGNLDEADAACRVSIAENRRQGQDRQLAYSYLTKADIDRDRGDLPNAERHARLAFEIFSRLDKRDYEGEAQTYRTLANISRHLRDFDQALDYLRTGIDLIEKRNSPRLLASLYQSYGRTSRHYATYLRSHKEVVREGIETEPSLFQNALIALEESISLAKQIGNPWEVARSQIEIALVTMLGKESYDQGQLTQLLDEVWQAAKDLDDELLKGYVFENRARIELRRGRYFEAGQAFGLAALHMAKRTGQESTRAFTRLHNLLLDEPFSNEQRDTLARGVLHHLHSQENQDNKRLIALSDMCEQILALPI